MPTQCVPVNGFWKYQMEKMTLMNFLTVRTRDAVRLVHSVVSTNTEKMQTYWRQMLARRCSTMMGADTPMMGTDTGGDARQTFQ